jgi:hypothetical protein
LRRRVTRRDTRFTPAALDDAEEDGADVAKWEHPLIKTGKFLKRQKQRSLACCSDRRGAARVRSTRPAACQQKADRTARAKHASSARNQNDCGAATITFVDKQGMQQELVVGLEHLGLQRA